MKVILSALTFSRPKFTCFFHSTYAEVIELANDTSYGLAAAVFSQNINRALNIGHKLEAGSVFVRCACSSNPFVVDFLRVR